ncbi:hypothetical protein BC829DRAFT_404230 [Chytridium lagenaria]|nr:hypothetical protein BC829DRAFT_404230 [Chytridium lagenaria]
MQSELKTIKKELKEWEHSFLSREGRKPDKKDIAADKDIARRYKSYAKLKAVVEGRDVPVSTKKKHEPVAETTPRRKDVDAGKGRQRKEIKEQVDQHHDILDGTELNVTSKIVPPTIPSSVPTVKANYLSKEALYESTSTLRTSIGGGNDGHGAEAAEKSRPWLRKSTIAAGPIPTDEALKAVQMRKQEEERSQRAAEANTAKPFSFGNAIYSYDNTTSSTVEPFMTTDFGKNEFQEFINHRSLLADRNSTPISSVPFKITSSPPQPQPLPQLLLPTHLLTTPSVVTPSKPTTVKVFNPPSSPPKKIDLSAFAKPYDPNDSDDSDVDRDSVAKHGNEPPPSVRVFGKPVPKGAFLDEPEDLPDMTSSMDQRPSVASPSASASPISGIKEMDVTSPRPRSTSKESEDVGASAETVVAVISDEDEGKDKGGLVKSNRDVLPFAVQKDLKPVDLMNPQVFLRVPLDSILRCKLYRKKNLLDKAHPSFFLYNEADDKFLLAARKRKKSKSVNYVISTSQEDLSKDSTHYVAKLRANFQRTNFILFDARNYNKNSKDKGLKELACVTYSKTVLPREMEVAIPSLNISENMTTQSHCLNFGVGTFSSLSGKMVQTSQYTYIVLQFGRCGPDYFTMDVRYPMTPMEAFAIAVTTFDAYDSA